VQAHNPRAAWGGKERAMAAVPIMIDGVLWDKAWKKGTAVVLTGMASLSGGPIIPPDQPPIEPPEQMPPPSQRWLMGSDGWYFVAGPYDKPRPIGGGKSGEVQGKWTNAGTGWYFLAGPFDKPRPITPPGNGGTPPVDPPWPGVPPEAIPPKPPVDTPPPTFDLTWGWYPLPAPGGYILVAVPKTVDPGNLPPTANVLPSTPQAQPVKK
jgi:hypothetical protein